MKKRIMLVFAVTLAALLFTGCAMQTVDEMYSPPKRSEEYNNLQSAIDLAMYGLDFSAPLSGENQQAVQMADLNGDGETEYLVFAKGTSDMPLQILIFDQDEDGKCQIQEIIESKGSAFEQVEYVDIDDVPGCEIVVGRQVSDQVLRSVAVYTFRDGNAEQLMSAAYSKILTCDLNSDSRGDLMVIQPGEADTANGIAVLYSYRDGVMERSVEAELSEQASSIKRIMVSRLDGGSPAVYVASAVNENAIITDVFALKNGRFTNVSISKESGVSVQTLRNYYVYGDDVDGDGILELPSLISMYPLSSSGNEERQYLIRWYAVNLEGREVNKLYSFHNYLGGWFVQLDDVWADRVSVDQAGNTYAFYVWDESFREASALFTIYALSGSDRDTQAEEDERFALYRTESVVYAARLETAADTFGITEELLINSFRLIRQDWKTGET